MSSASPSLVGRGGGPGTVSVSTGRDCTWTAAAGTAWISGVTPESGQGAGTVTFQVAANTGAARTGTLTVGGHTVSVSQEAGCAFTVSPLTVPVPAAGGARTVTVAGVAGCGWNATGSAPWVSITSGASGTGGGSVSFTIDANAGPARSATLLVAGRSVTVNQASGCVYAVAPSGRSIGLGGGSNTIAVTTNDGCPWTATSDQGWLTIVDGAQGSGSGTVRYQAAQFSNPQIGQLTRIGLITIADQTFTVLQTIFP